MSLAPRRWLDLPIATRGVLTISIPMITTVGIILAVYSLQPRTEHVEELAWHTVMVQAQAQDIQTTAGDLFRAAQCWQGTTSCAGVYDRTAGDLQAGIDRLMLLVRVPEQKKAADELRNLASAYSESLEKISLPSSSQHSVKDSARLDRIRASMKHWQAFRNTCAGFRMTKRGCYPAGSPEYRGRMAMCTYGLLESPCCLPAWEPRYLRLRFPGVRRVWPAPWAARNGCWTTITC